MAKKKKKTPEELEEERRKREAEAKETISQREKRKAELVAQGLAPTTAAKQFRREIRAEISPRETERRRLEEETAKRIEEERKRAGFMEVTGAEELRAELEEKIREPPSLVPEPIIEEMPPIVGVEERAIAPPLGITGVGETALLFKDPKTYLKKLGVTLGVGAAALAAPYLVGLAAKAGIAKAVMGVGGSVPVLKTAIAGLAVFVGLERAFDYEGAEMDVFRAGLKKVVEDGERMEAAVRNGYPVTDSMEILMAINNETVHAEQRIKELGIYNLQYRVSKEYILDQMNVRSSRLAILRRLNAVENIAATGQAAFRPEELLFEVKQFGEGGGGGK